MNPLLKLKLTWWERYVLGVLAGSDWANKIWNGLTIAFTAWQANNEQATITDVVAWLQGHIATFFESVLHANVFFAITAANILTNQLTPLAEALIATVATKVGLEGSGEPSTA